MMSSIARLSTGSLSIPQMIESQQQAQPHDCATATAIKTAIFSGAFFIAFKGFLGLSFFTALPIAACTFISAFFLARAATFCCCCPDDYPQSSSSRTWHSHPSVYVPAYPAASPSVVVVDGGRRGPAPVHPSGHVSVGGAGQPSVSVSDAPSWWSSWSRPSAAPVGGVSSSRATAHVSVGGARGGGGGGGYSAVVTPSSARPASSSVHVSVGGAARRSR